MSRRWTVIGRRLIVAVAGCSLVAVAVGDSTPGSPDAPPAEPVLHELESLPAPSGEPPAHASTTANVQTADLQTADVQDDPGSLTRFRDRVGTSLLVRVTGNASAGSVYGSGVYTDDSTLAAAVVHDGWLDNGETGVVRVTILPGQANYDAATRHGITSYAYGRWSGSYRVSRGPSRIERESGPRSGTPDTLSGREGLVGKEFVFPVTGTTDGVIWGSGLYTADSDLSTAAVHAGVLKPGETGQVRVTMLPGLSKYHGSLQHGVVSRSYHAWRGTYHVAAVDDESSSSPVTNVSTTQLSPSETARDDEVRDDPGNLTVFHRSVDDTILFRLTGSTDGVVWGSGPYTSDSDLSTAAVHAGVLQPGETGVVKVTVQPVQFGFPGTERNSVTTLEWLPWDGNYRIERVAAGNDTTGGFSSGGITITR